MNKSMGLFERKCHTCKKTFEARPLYYVYKRGTPDHYIWFCSYHCMREYDKRPLKGKRVTKYA